MMKVKPETVDVDWLRGIPKVELHAHLHGSVRLETLGKLAKRKGQVEVEELVARIETLKARTLEDCFQLFDVIYEVVTDKQDLEEIAHQVFQDFIQDGTVYLELRTTPRRTESLSELEYVETFLTIMKMYCNETFVPRCIMSINRANGPDHAEHVIDLIANMLTPDLRSLVVGIDFSGNPFKGEFEAFVPALTRAREELGLKVTIHCGEIRKDEEVYSIMKFRPDRLGHALILPEAVNRQLVRQLIPIECCPSSNCKTLALQKGLLDHPHLERWLKSGYPIAICTDDAGVFQTTMSKELAMVAQAFHLTKREIVVLNMNAFQFAFIQDDQGRRIVQKLLKSRL